MKLYPTPPHLVEFISGMAIVSYRNMSSHKQKNHRNLHQFLSTDETMAMTVLCFLDVESSLTNHWWHCTQNRDFKDLRNLSLAILIRVWMRPLTPKIAKFHGLNLGVYWPFLWWFGLNFSCWFSDEVKRSLARFLWCKRADFRTVYVCFSKKF